MDHEIFKIEINKVQIKVVGKVDIWAIDSSTRPIKQKKSKKRFLNMPQVRDEMDSGWNCSFRMMQRNYLKSISKNNHDS